MGKLFDAVRDGVTAEAAARFYGLQFGRNGRAVCPWHDDHSPDLAFYDGGARCYCHACHGGGDSIALVAQLFDLSPLDAARKLNADFRLNVNEAPTTPRIGPSRAELRQVEKQRRAQRWAFLCDVEREAQAIASAARSWDDPGFLRALTALGRVQDELDGFAEIYTTDGGAAK